jgi:hypothetical protein
MLLAGIAFVCKLKFTGSLITLFDVSKPLPGVNYYYPGKYDFSIRV